eukprot:SAG31_NODE_1949_length_6833_cov_4.354024_7_plen_86_part_00
MCRNGQAAVSSLCAECSESYFSSEKFRCGIKLKLHTVRAEFFRLMQHWYATKTWRAEYPIVVELMSTTQQQYSELQSMAHVESFE